MCRLAELLVEAKSDPATAAGQRAAVLVRILPCLRICFRGCAVFRVVRSFAFGGSALRLQYCFARRTPAHARLPCPGCSIINAA